VNKNERCIVIIILFWWLYPLAREATERGSGGENDDSDDICGDEWTADEKRWKICCTHDNGVYIVTIISDTLLNK